MDPFIEILIKALEETTRTKEYLNEVCEESWNMISPHGTQNNGMFLKDNTIISKHNPVLDERKHTSSLESVCYNVNNLIDYARCVRSSQNCKIFGLKEKKTVTTQKSSTQDENVETLQTSLGSDMLLGPRNEGQKIRLKGQCTSSEKNVAAKRKQGLHFKEDFDLGKPTHSQPERYTHSCSYTLNDNVKSFKITKDHLHILRQYHCCESLKNLVSITGSTQNSVMHDFKDKCIKQVKVKLKKHLEMNIKQEKRYLKYLDLASTTYSDCIPKLSSNYNNLGFTFTNLQYSSLEQLRLFEVKYQHLLELQQQSGIMDMIINEIG